MASSVLLVYLGCNFQRAVLGGLGVFLCFFVFFFERCLINQHDFNIKK